jgi:hypothetical protein
VERRASARFAGEDQLLRVVVESGEVFDMLSGSKGKKIQIDVITKYKPTEDALQFFGHAEAFLRQEGIGFAHGAGPDGYEAAEL